MDNKYEKINHVCSLGSLCHSSIFIKNNKLKLCSYPFDWIYSSPKIIETCLDDNFESFLDKSQYININSKRCGHKIFYPKMFYHKNPLINQEHDDYYVRCVERFRELLNLSNSKLFIIMSTNNTMYNEKYYLDIIKLDEKLSQYTSNYKILAIYNVSNQTKNYHKLTKISNIDLLEFHTTSYSNGIHFIRKHDNEYLDKIINSMYKFELL